MSSEKPKAQRILVSELRNILRNREVAPSIRMRAALALMEIEKHKPGATKRPGRPRKDGSDAAPVEDFIQEITELDPELKDLYERTKDTSTS